MWFLRWAKGREAKQLRGRMGWFSGLVRVGSVAEVVSWAALMKRSVFLYRRPVPGIGARQYFALSALSACSQVWNCVFFFINRVEFPRIKAHAAVTPDKVRRTQLSDTCARAGRVKRREIER